MNRIEYEDLTYESYLRRSILSKRKSQDYANSEDVLSNFKRLAFICSDLELDVREPEGVATFFIIHKLDRLWKLIKSGATPKNESLQDTLNDLKNYADLLEAIIHEAAALFGETEDLKT